MAAEQKDVLQFRKENYIILLVGVLVVILGFILMTGGGSGDPDIYNPEIFSFRRITLAPIVVLLGYALVMYSILKKPKN